MTLMGNCGRHMHARFMQKVSTVGYSIGKPFSTDRPHLILYAASLLVFITTLSLTIESLGMEPVEIKCSGSLFGLKIIDRKA